MTDIEELLRTVPLWPGTPLTLPPSASGQVWKIGRVRRRRRLAITSGIGTATAAALLLVAVAATHGATGATLKQDRSVTPPTGSCAPRQSPTSLPSPGVPQPAADQDARDLPGYRLGEIPDGYSRRGRVMVTEPRTGSTLTSYTTGFDGPAPGDPTVTVTLVLGSGGSPERPGETALITPTGVAFEEAQNPGGLHFDVITWKPQPDEQLIVQAASTIGTSQARVVAETIARGIIRDACTAASPQPDGTMSVIATIDGHAVTYLPSHPYPLARSVGACQDSKNGGCWAPAVTKGEKNPFTVPAAPTTPPAPNSVQLWLDFLPASVFTGLAAHAGTPPPVAGVAEILRTSINGHPALQTSQHGNVSLYVSLPHGTERIEGFNIDLGEVVHFAQGIG